MTKRCIVCDKLFNAPKNKKYYGVNVKEGAQMCGECLYYIRSSRQNRSKSASKSPKAEIIEWRKKEKELRNRKRGIDE